MVFPCLLSYFSYFRVLFWYHCPCFAKSDCNIVFSFVWFLALIVAFTCVYIYLYKKAKSKFIFLRIRSYLCVRVPLVLVSCYTEVPIILCHLKTAQYSYVHLVSRSILDSRYCEDIYSFLDLRFTRHLMVFPFILFFFNGCHLFSVYFIHILLASWITSFFDSHIRCESVLIVWIVLNFFPSSYACVISSHLSYLLHWFSFFLFLKTQWFYPNEFMILLNTNWVC